MRRRIFWPLLLVLLASLQGCSGLVERPDPPKVSLAGFRSLPSGDSGPRFELTLRVINPNAQALEISGISYTIELLDRELIVGVSNDVPVIEAYSEDTVRLESSLQLLQLLRLFTELGVGRDETIPYRLSAKVDFKGLLPTQRIEERGEINLQR